jgi:hypothetical protein
VLAKLALALGLLVLVAAALRLSGEVLSANGQGRAGGDTVKVIDPEARRLEWIDQVGAICEWERKRMKTLKRAYRERAIIVPKDLELMILGVIHMGDESKAIFNRLTPPFEYRREVQQLRTHFQEERRALEGLVDAVRNYDQRQFLRRWRDLVRADARKVEMLRNLGLTKCVPPLPLPKSEEPRSTVV